MESIKQTVNSGIEAVTQGGAEQKAAAQKQSDKSTAENSNAGLGERASAGISALGNKKDETAAAGNKEAAKQNL